MQRCKYASSNDARMFVFKYLSMQVCKYASMQVWEYESMQACMYKHVYLKSYNKKKEKHRWPLEKNMKS